LTWSRIGVERSSVADVLRPGVDRGDQSSTWAKLRSAWMPPAVAQAPIVTSRREIRRTNVDPLGVLRPW
jgi:hypothetical protein